MRIDGEVDEARCTECGATSVTFTFSGDSDTTTVGLAAACAGSRHLVLGELTSAELSAGDLGVEAFVKRAGDALGTECQSIRVKRYEGGTAPIGLSFAEFRSAYSPARPIYRCPVCDGDAVITATSSRTEFVRSGGVIDLLGDVAFSDDH
jgi:hypothetical protein